MPTPFINERFTFTNPDGSTVEVIGSGNQFFAHFETDDGYTASLVIKRRVILYSYHPAFK